MNDGIKVLAFLIVSWVIAAAPAMAEPVKLTIWQGFKFSEVPMLKQNVQEFTQQWLADHGEEIIIQIDQVPFDEMVRKVRMAAGAQLLPDIVFVDANQMTSLAYGGVALALDTVPGETSHIEALRNQYVPGAFDTNVIRFKGKKHLYGLPAQTTTLALFWNKRLFRENAEKLTQAGLDPNRAPRDWDEFTAYGTVLTQPQKGIYGFGMHNSLWFTMPFLNQYGVSLVQNLPDGTVVPALLETGGVAALERKAAFFLTDKIEGGAWREGSLNPDQGFQNEKYAMVLTGPWMIENFRSSGLEFGVALVPRVPMSEAVTLGLIPPGTPADSPAAEHLSSSSIGGQNIVVTRTCRRPDAAVAFARYFTSEKVQRRWATDLGQIPVLLAAHENLELPQFPEVSTFIKQVRLARALPALPFLNMLETEIFNPEMNLVLQGNQSAEQALKRIETALQKQILEPLNQQEQTYKSPSTHHTSPDK